MTQQMVRLADAQRKSVRRRTKSKLPLKMTPSCRPTAQAWRQSMRFRNQDLHTARRSRLLVPESYPPTYPRRRQLAVSQLLGSF